MACHGVWETDHLIKYDTVPKLSRSPRVTPCVTRSGTLSKHIDTADLKIQGAQQVMTVTEFALQYKITSDEQLRLTKLLGMFATKQEFLMNVRLKSRIRH